MSHPEPAQERAPSSLSGLVGHILSRYHDTHRRELPVLILQARAVEQLHAAEPLAPHGLGDALSLLALDLEAHMRKEEAELFPALLGSEGQPLQRLTLESVRHDHDFQDDALRVIQEVTHGFSLPDDACGTWRQLYCGVLKLAADLREHIRLENEELLDHLMPQAA